MMKKTAAAIATVQRRHSSVKVIAGGVALDRRRG
jgi:hypothetical protein